MNTNTNTNTNTDTDTDTIMDTEYGYIFHSEFYETFIKIFFLVAATLVIIVGVSLYQTNPIQSQKVEIRAKIVFVETVILLLFLLLRRSYLGFIIIITPKGIIIRKGIFSKFFILGEYYQYLPWEDIQAIVNMEIESGLFKPEYYLCIILEENASTLFTRKIVIPMTLIEVECRSALENAINEYKPNFIEKSETPKSIIYSYVNTIEQTHKVASNIKTKKHTKIQKLRVFWIFVIFIFFVSIHETKMYHNADDSFFYMRYDFYILNYFPEDDFAMKFNVPENWLEWNMRSEDNILTGTYYITLKPDKKKDDFFNHQAEATISMCEIDNDLYSDYSSLNLDEWSLVKESTDTYNVKLINESITYPKKNIKQTRRDYLKLFLSEYNSGDYKDESVKLMTEIILECEDKKISMLIETTEKRNKFGKSLEDDKNFENMKRMHEKVISDALLAAVLDKPSKL